MSTETMRRLAAVGVITVVVGTVVAACTTTRAGEESTVDASGADTSQVSAYETTTRSTTGAEQESTPVDTDPNSVTAMAASLSVTDSDGLIWMREEEKLARDVYLTLYEEWGAPIFERIAASEQRHTDAVSNLIERFGLDDPVSDDSVGVFADPELQALYADLVARGSSSLEEALAVGALIEDLDISDLSRLLEETDVAAIERVYANLLAGSENHLRAFVRQIEAAGGEFTPTSLDQSDVDEILAQQGADRPRGRDRGRTIRA